MKYLLFSLIICLICISPVRADIFGPTQSAGDIDITDTGNYYTGTDVETALQEIGAGTTLNNTYLKLNQSTPQTITGGSPAFNGGESGVSAPFTVDSTYLVTNLNADLLDGSHASAFQAAGTYVTSVTGTSPISSSGGTTPAISIANAAADGLTKGAASFAASDFDATTGNISIDYTNGQAASGTLKGFLTSADWTTFNNKVSTTRTINTTSPLSGGGDLSADRTFSLAGLSSLGTANYLLGANSLATAWEYKQILGVANETDISHAAGSVTIGLVDPLAVTKGGTGVSSWTNGQLLIGNTTGNTAALATLTGTTNQVTVTNGASSITLATPQDIATSSTPQFARLGLGQSADATFPIAITTSTGATGIQVQSTSAGTSGAFLHLFHNSASPAANDVAGRLEWDGQRLDNNKYWMAYIDGVWTDPATLVGTSRMVFHTRNGDVDNTAMTIDHLGAVNIGNVSITGGSITGITDLAVADGGTAKSSWTANGILYASGTTTLANSANLTYDGTNFIVGGSSPYFRVSDDGWQDWTFTAGHPSSVGTLTISRSGGATAVMTLNENGGSGRVGIGVAPPVHRLDVYSNVASQNVLHLEAGSSNTDPTLKIDSAAGRSIFINKSGGGETILYLIQNDTYNNKFIEAYGGGETPLLFEVNGGGNIWTVGDCSALTFTDRTPYPKTLQEAYDSVLSIGGIDEKVDHSKLNDFVKSVSVKTKYNEITKQNDIVGTEIGRNLSATVSAQNAVIKDLIARITALEKK